MLNPAYAKNMRIGRNAGTSSFTVPPLDLNVAPFAGCQAPVREVVSLRGCEFDEKKYQFCRLIRGEVLALIIPGLVSDYICRQVSSWAIQSTKRVDYSNDVADENGTRRKLSFGVDRIGPALNTIYKGSQESDLEIEARLQQYLTDKSYFENLIGDRFGCENPIIALTNNLGGYWQYGSTRLRVAGQNAFAGILRLTRPDAQRLQESPHIDSLPREFGEFELGQFSVNVYLNMPTAGGELLLYNTAFLSQAEIDVLPQTDWSSVLGDPVVLKPEVGSAIIFATRGFHAVNSYQSDSIERVAWQTFFLASAGKALAFYN